MHGVWNPPSGSAAIEGKSKSAASETMRGPVSCFMGGTVR